MVEKIRLGLRNLFRRQETERELDAELLEYLERSVEQKMQAGMPHEEAMRAARAEFGSVEAVKDSVRDAGWESLIDGIRGDLVFAVRMMRRSPGFTAVIVATLALGIGANTALFTVINAVLLKPLPVSHPNELALMVWDSENPKRPLADGYDGSSSDDFSTTGHEQGTSFPYITYERMAQAKDTFSHVFAFAAIEQLNVIVDGSAEVAPGQYVSGDYYNGLGVAAWRGRLLNEEDEADGAPPAAVITWRYWQRRFSGDEGALGKTVLVNNEKFTIVGVSPPGFNGALELGQSVDVTLPVTSERHIEAANANMGKPGLWWLHIMARLQPGVSREQAQARMDSVFQQSAIDGLSAAIAAGQARPRTIEARDYPHLLLSPGAQGDEYSRRRFRRPLTLLMGVVGLVLLIVCINVANLLLARSAARQQELAMRVALGAKPLRLMRQLLTESLLLSAIAGGAGVVLAVWGKDLLLAWSRWIQSGSMSAGLDAGLDARVLAFAFSVSVLTGLLFGVAPAVRAGISQSPRTVKAQIGSADGRKPGRAAY
jgi:predicted permease